MHTPETSRERDFDNVKRDAKAAGLTFPIIVDGDKKNWDAWGNSMWPSIYLIDKRGDIRYWWFGELDWKGVKNQKVMEQRIAELLAE